jgi:hypothetical protein
MKSGSRRLRRLFAKDFGVDARCSLALDAGGVGSWSSLAEGVSEHDRASGMRRLRKGSITYESTCADGRKNFNDKNPRPEKSYFANLFIYSIEV